MGTINNLHDVRGMITFLPAKDLEKTHAFYHGFLGFPMSHDQGSCRIYLTPSGSIGFCTGYGNHTGMGVVCFVLDSREQVDSIYEKLKVQEPLLGISLVSQPSHRPEFGIHQFYALDPEGNRIEFQCFL
ncbi:MAG: VOC family protein [Clostridia bacterium]